MTEIENRVLTIVSDVLNVSRADLNSESTSESTKGWDSVGHLNLVVALEEAFELAFEPEDIERMSSVREMVRVISARQNSA